MFTQAQVAFVILPIFALANAGIDRIFAERLGILIGSLLSGIVGYLVLRSALKPVREGSKA